MGVGEWETLQCTRLTQYKKGAKICVEIRSALFLSEGDIATIASLYASKHSSILAAVCVALSPSQYSNAALFSFQFVKSLLTADAFSLIAILKSFFI